MRLVSVNLRVTPRRDPKVQLYTVHCLSPISVFCDVFVTNAYGFRKRAARFHLDKSLAISNNASGSSANHTEGEFISHGLRTPKRQSKYSEYIPVPISSSQCRNII